MSGISETKTSAYIIGCVLSCLLPFVSPTSLVSHSISVGFIRSTVQLRLVNIGMSCIFCVMRYNSVLLIFVPHALYVTNIAKSIGLAFLMT